TRKSLRTLESESSASTNSASPASQQIKKGKHAIFGSAINNTLAVWTIRQQLRTLSSFACTPLKGKSSLKRMTFLAVSHKNVAVAREKSESFG
ncbi:MAG: hypothetical protein AAFR12_23475, partial [Cyanobacteria bacterium J06626_6]